MSVYLVSREAVLDILQDLRENDPFPEYRTAIREIERMPSTEAEPVVHAHWNGDCCSRCGELAEENYPRCPYCGAHTDEEVVE